MNRLRNIVLPWLPAGWVTALKRWYYPRLVRNFDPARWPCSVAVRQHVRQGDTVVDVGANIGYITGLLSGWVGAAGHVHSFEPVPDTFGLLQHNANSLGWKNVTLYSSAASDRCGEATMGIPAYGEGGENLYESHLVEAGTSVERGERAVKVRLQTLDQCLAGQVQGRLSLIKIDVEGHEAAVVRGAQALLEAHRPMLVIEVNSDPEAAGSDAASMFEGLLRMGYTVHLPLPDGCCPRRAGERSVDYIFLPEEDAGRG